MNPGESVFSTHRDKVLGHYSTASWLRQLVLAMWRGSDYPVGLSTLYSIDAEHFAAAIAMMQSYRKHGEDDESFMALAIECQQRIEAEKAAAERATRLEAWCKQAQRAVVEAGGRECYVSDHFGWFEIQFIAGYTPEGAADLALKILKD